MTYLIDCKIIGYYTVRVEVGSLADAAGKWQKAIDEIDFGRIDSPEIEPISCYKDE